jgi:hypothetical protein
MTRPSLQEKIAQDCFQDGDLVWCPIRQPPVRGGRWPNPSAAARSGGSTLVYLAAWDGGRGDVMGACEPSTGLEPLGRLVTQVMEQEPSRSADRVYGVVDQGRRIVDKRPSGA